ncbi:PIN domain-containing protein [Methylocaldum marinum]|uniref:type II toxin-antitoxin system VapC family toxin n=1 Tax=Methylocaldum marinum TaxID=1432792 RepID=UPI0011AE6897|nr:type II toxin-antitoxin system VapC family toxin [Methylocaldum marinum]
MNLLLDTHIFLWFIAGDPRLDRAVTDRIRNPALARERRGASGCAFRRQFACGREFREAKDPQMSSKIAGASVAVP